jgi:hypothetical protein
MNAEQSVTATFTAAGGTQPPPGSGPGPGGSAAAAPKCQLSAKPKRGRKGAPTRQLSLTFTCDQSANLTLAGTITEQLARHRTKTFRLRTVHANATAGRSGTVTVSLPRGAVSGLRKHRREAAALSLVAANPNGQGRATARITRL